MQQAENKRNVYKVFKIKLKFKNQFNIPLHYEVCVRGL